MTRGNFLASSISGIAARKAVAGVGRAVLRAAAGFLAGLLASSADVFTKCAPFGIAAVASAEPSDGLFVLAGAVAGYLLPQGPEYAARYVAACVAVYIFRWVTASFEQLTSHKAFAPVLAGAAAGITGIAVVFASGTNPYDMLLLFAETLLCCCSALFFKSAFSHFNNPSGLWGLTQHELVSVAVSGCVLLLALERIQFTGVSVGRIVAVAVILTAARYGRESGGGITGVSAGMILSLNGGSMTHMLSGYGFGGLIAGVFAPLGRFWCALAFILANAMAGMAASGTTQQILTSSYEVAVATVIFLLIPERLLCRISGVFVPPHTANGAKLREALCKRLNETACALEGISSTVSEVSTKLRRTNAEDISGVYENAADITCRSCGMNMYCWGTVYSDTMNVLNSLSEQLRRNQTLTREDMPRYFVARCCKLGDFVGTINRCYAEFTARHVAELKTEQLRSVLAPEFGNAACLLRNIAQEYEDGARQMDGGERVRSAFAECGLNAAESVISLDTHGRVTIDAQIDGNPSRINRAELLSSLAATCGRRFAGPNIIREESSGALRMEFTQKPELSIEFGEAMIQKNGETLCGDACEAFIDEKGGRAVLILADGMGCGGSAAIDSNLTVDLMSRLLRCGFGFDEAVKVTSSAMMVKSGEESFSTLDIASIDLFDGTATFLKAGAPPTYLRRCGRVERVAPNSMPIGILPDVKLEKASARLRRGDVVVVLSDGAVPDDDDFVIKAIEKFSGNPREFARKLAQKAKKLRGDGHDDDITVLTALIA